MEYFWDYYKWHLIIFICVVGIIGNIVYTNVTAKDYILQGVFLNSTGEVAAGNALEQNFLTFSPIDTAKENIFFDTNYYFSADTDSSMATNSYDTI